MTHKSIEYPTHLRELTDRAMKLLDEVDEIKAKMRVVQEDYLRVMGEYHRQRGAWVQGLPVIRCMRAKAWSRSETINLELRVVRETDSNWFVFNVERPDFGEFRIRKDKYRGDTLEIEREVWTITELPPRGDK